MGSIDPMGEKAGKASFLEMVQYADTHDMCLMALGVLGSVGDGMMQPLSMLVLADIVNSYGAAGSAASGTFTAPAKIDVQAEIEQQSRADEEASRRTVAEAIAAAQELERPGVRPHATSNSGNGNGDASHDNDAKHKIAAVLRTKTETHAETDSMTATLVALS